MRNRPLKFSVFQTTVTLNEGQGHPNWYQNVDFSDWYHHIKFGKNIGM